MNFSILSALKLNCSSRSKTFQFHLNYSWFLSCSYEKPEVKDNNTSKVSFWLWPIISRITSILKLVGLADSAYVLASFITIFKGFVLSLKQLYICFLWLSSMQAQQHTRSSKQLGSTQTILHISPKWKPALEHST